MTREAQPRSITVYEDADGNAAFDTWFNGLEARAAARVTRALTQLERGGGDLKALGEGVAELRINYGPGYRVYFGQDGETLIILLCGGTKKRQQKDIEHAKALWADYKARKAQAAADATPKTKIKKNKKS
ncbi:MAG: type II toxin-antitoxin system RelE/ParE family toxin [Alphaproteobacteria bacterium]|nr:type II toxin-antitoxin system RelE/ParE family toxin [Alphaproteobacteria bacterium]